MNGEDTGQRKRLSSGVIAGFFVTLFFGVSLFIRAYLPHDQIFSGEWVKFSSVDAYFHMRLIDSLLHNFPALINFDPYLLYPTGMNIGNVQFFDWLLAGIIWVFGLGLPDPRTVDVISVYFPPVLAALTVIPVYFIGKELFGRGVGVIAAGLTATLPGEFLGRSILGFTDHHVAEVLFTTVTMMFLITAVRQARENGLKAEHLRNRDWKTVRKPLVYSLLTGLSLGIFLVTWIGGLLFVFIIMLYFVFQFAIDHLRRNDTGYLLLAGTITSLVALLIYMVFVGGTFTLSSASVIPWLSLLISAAIPVVLYLISKRFTAWKFKTYYYPLTLVALGIIALFLGRAIYPDFMRSALDVFNLGATRTILEMQPIMAPRGEFTLEIVWGNFNTGFFLAAIFLAYFIVYYILRILIGRKVSEFKIGSARLFPESLGAGLNILLIWSLVIFIATLGQRRFAYYFAMNVSLLSGFLAWHYLRLNWEVHHSAKHLNIFISLGAIIYIVFFSGVNPALAGILVAMLIANIFWQFFQGFGFLQFSRPGPEPPKKSKHRAKAPSGFSSALYYSNLAVVIIIIFFLAFFPSVAPVRAISSAQFVPPNAWVRSLEWMRTNTPEPFGDPDYYYRLYKRPQAGTQYEYPDSSYAVMAWVDQGYWITRIAHRPVNLTPGPGGSYVARFFLSQSEDSSQEVTWETAWEKETIPESAIIDKLGSKYIMLDDQTSISKFWALANWAEADFTRYVDAYFVPQAQGRLMLVNLFYPEYYRSLAVRLYNFNGEAVTPMETAVISYEERPLQQGGLAKVVTGTEFFTSYEEAQNHIAEQKSGNFRIVGESPFISPVPLEALTKYRLVYQSPETSYQPGVGNMPQVKIFEYLE